MLLVENDPVVLSVVVELLENEFYFGILIFFNVYPVVFLSNTNLAGYFGIVLFGLLIVAAELFVSS